MQIKRLKLYGSKGIDLGLGLYEVDINFGLFKAGLIGLFGASGSGKSTILNNLNPFRTNFKENFYEDGCRELEFVFKDETYVSQVYQTKAMLFKNGSLMNPSQKVSTYDEVLEAEIGDESTFYKLMYAGRRFKNILDLTKGEKKELFVDYLLDYLKEYEKHLSKMQLEQNTKLNERTALLNKIDLLKQNETKILEANNKIHDSELELVGLTVELKNLESYQKKHDDRETELQEVRQKIQVLNEQIRNSQNIINNTAKQIEDSDRKLDSIVKEFEKLDEKINNCPKSEYTLEDAKEYIAHVEEDIDSDKAIIADHQEVKKELQHKTDNLLKLKSELMRLEKSEPPCDVGLQLKCPLTKNIDYSSIIDNLRSEIDVLTNDVSELEDEVNRFKAPDSNPLLLELKRYKNELLIIEEYNKLDGYRELRDKIQLDGQELGDVVDKLEATKEQAVELLNRQISEKDLLNAGCNNGYNDRRSEITKASNSIAYHEALITTIKSQIEELEKELSRIADCESRISELDYEIEQYNPLIQFFGKNGGSLFDLEQAGGEISAIANKLLENYNGQQITIKFETLKINAKGETKEVFDIHASINGREWQIYLSDGQAVLVSNAIREAMCYLRKDREFETVFIDELEGAIDTNNRVGFVKLLEEGNTMNNRKFTFLISHSDEVKSHLEQYIKLEEGQVKLIY